jgi:hypothetical protein
LAKRRVQAKQRNAESDRERDGGSKRAGERCIVEISKGSEYFRKVAEGRLGSE